MFSVEARQVGHSVVLALRGDLDYDSAAQLHEAREKVLMPGRGGGPVVIDCAGLLFCDSSGVSAFIRLHRQLASQERALRLASVPSKVSRLFELTGLDQVFSVHTDVRGALAGDLRVVDGAVPDDPDQPDEERHG
ncbi:STAS domain-containing protein [Streptomyces sp. NPDC001904]|uniref:STAS domain-containing protein n=1 Tax=Streptomyces sp. NPDC001904 TaxID=3154531 RepID=UPI00332F2A8C